MSPNTDNIYWEIAKCNGEWNAIFTARIGFPGEASGRACVRACAAVGEGAGGMY